MQQFYHDANMRMVAMDDAGTLTYYTWDRNGMNLLQERNASGTVTADYTHGYAPIDGSGTLAGAKKEASGVTYYQYPIINHHGDVVKVVDDNGAVKDSYVFNAWGELIGETTSGAPNAFDWQSNWLRLKEGILKSPARVYFDSVGRFAQRDPLGCCRDGTNIYVYSHMALRLADPKGLTAGMTGLESHTGVQVDLRDEKMNIIACFSADFHAIDYMGDTTGGNASSRGDIDTSSGGNVIAGTRGRVGLTLKMGSGCAAFLRRVNTTLLEEERLRDFILASVGKNMAWLKDWMCFGKPTAQNLDAQGEWSTYKVLARNCFTYTDRAMDALKGFDWHSRVTIIRGPYLLAVWDSEYDETGHISQEAFEDNNTVYPGDPDWDPPEAVAPYGLSY